MALAGGSHLSAREGNKMGTGSGRFEGPWVDSDTGPIRIPGALFHFYFVFSFFFFCFLISLITFANLVQIASNQLCRVSKIQNNIPE
jgi:hypothetical protein